MVHLHKNAALFGTAKANGVNQIYLYNACDLSSAKFDDFKKEGKKILLTRERIERRGGRKLRLTFFLFYDKITP